MIKYSGIIFVLIALLSCTNEDMTFQIGSRYVDPKTNVRYVDTLTVNSYTIKLDSMRTSGLEDPSILVGKYLDDAIGNIQSRSFFRVNPPKTFSIPDNAVYDSLELIMTYTGYSLGDTNKTYTITAHRLTRALRTDEGGYFYNTSSTQYDPENLGATTLMPWPNTNDTLWMRLDDNLGNELFTMLNEKDQIITESELFHFYFKGFALDFDGNNKAILEFNFPSKTESSSTGAYYPTMRLYYHYFDYVLVNEYVDFKIGTENVDLQYNQFTISDPVFELPANQRDKVPSSETDDVTYVQAGTGILTRLEVPFLKNLLAVHNYILIMKAEMVIEPVRNTYGIFPLPQDVSLYNSDQINRFGSSFRASGNLSLDEIYQEDTYYTFDVTSYIKAKFEEVRNETPTFILTVSPENLYKSLDRIIVGSQGHEENRIKLKIYYVDYE
jgi:hypothetical protein